MEIEVSYAVLCSRQIKDDLLSITGACFLPCPGMSLLKVLGMEGELLVTVCLCFWWLIVLCTLDNFK